MKTSSHPGLNRGLLTLAVSALPPELWPPGDSQPSILLSTCTHTHYTQYMYTCTCTVHSICTCSHGRCPHTKGLEISLAHSMTYDPSDPGQHRRIQVCEDGRALVGLLMVWQQTVLGGGNHVALAAHGEREGGKEGGREGGR